jgi:hypothetical protein
MSNFLELSENEQLRSNINLILSLMKEIISYKNQIKKLSEHPFHEWCEWFSTEIYTNMLSPGLLLLNEKESTELLNDFKNSKNTKFLILIKDYHSQSIKVSKLYVEDSIREKYISTIHSTASDFSNDEFLLIKNLRSFE